MHSCVRIISMTAITLIGLLFLSSAARADQPTTESTKAPAMSLQEAAALGVIEGMTEYLPVSSTGHLLIFQHWLGRNSDDDETTAAHALAICIQSGAIVAVVLLYFQRLLQMARGLLGGDPNGLRLFFHLIVAFFPAAVVGILFQKTIKQHLFNIQSITLAVAAGAVLILLIPGLHKSDDQTIEKDLPDIRWSDALIVGCLQCVAFWPGFSRSLATIVGCRFVRLRMAASVEFSFLLGLITLTAATAKEGASHGPKIVEQFGVTAPVVALVVAFVSAVISVKFMVNVISRFGLTPFGYYRLLLAALCLLLWK